MTIKKSNGFLHLQNVLIVDPLSGVVQVEIWKDRETGGVFGINTPFLEAENGCYFNPFTGEKQVLDVEDMT